jgi:crotonobetainyl-CoA:carnitine CoA-transferase CaiB-like acyl-CoA transferase
MQKDDFYREARTNLTGPLQGMRVLEATTSWAGPMCGCMFADLGADVIKVEAIEGEVGRRAGPFITGEDSKVSFLHATVNRNKRSLTLDLRKPDGRDIFLKLAARSDVVVQNFRPGTFDKWGIGY